MIILPIVFIVLLCVFIWCVHDDEHWATLESMLLWGMFFVVVGFAVVVSLHLGALSKYGHLIGTKHSIEAMEVSDAYTEAEFHQMVLDYNKEVDFFRYMRRTFLGRQIYPPVPPELTRIDYERSEKGGHYD